MAAPMSRNSSSSEDENADRLREAVVGSSFLYINSSTVKEDQPNLPSLRPSIVDVGDEDNELQTTPGFRSHVAKKLTQLIDSQLLEVEASCRCPPSETTQSQGIRLFSKSTKFVAVDEDIKQTRDKRKRPVAPCSSSSDSSCDERLMEASVSFSAVQEMGRIQNYDKRSNSDVVIISGDQHKDKTLLDTGDGSSTVPIDNHKKHKRRKKIRKSESEKNKIT